MPSSLQFVIALVVIVVLWMAVSLIRSKTNIKEFIKSPDFKGIAKGIVLAICFALGLVFIGSLTGCVNDAYVFAGLDQTKKISPQCEAGGVDDRATSNIGIRANFYQSEDERFRINGQYTHHSCFMNSDRNSYDAVGLSLEYKIYSRY